MQSLSLERSYDPSVVADHLLFSGLLPPAHNWAPAVGLSLVLHVLMVGCAVLVQEYLPLFQPATLDGRCFPDAAGNRL